LIGVAENLSQKDQFVIEIYERKKRGNILAAGVSKLSTPVLNFVLLFNEFTALMLSL
jgi:predicted RNA-binding protein